MRDISYFGGKISVEEYVKKEICKNTGTQSVALKAQLIYLCESANIECNNRMKKEELFDLLLHNGFSHKQLAELFEVGVSSQAYQSTFNISHRDVKRLEKRGILKKIGEYRFRAFGRYNYAPLYDLYQYAQMTDDDMRNMLKK